MKNNYNTLLQYLYENSQYECTKETVDGLFRAILEPLFNNQKYESTVLLRLKDSDKKKTQLQRLAFSNVEIFSFNNIDNQKSDIWESVEFLIVLGSRYSAALIWDYENAEKKGYAKLCLIYNSKLIIDLVKRISDNSNVDFKQYLAERRQNILLNQSINQLVSFLNEKNEEALFNEKNNNSNDDILQTANIVAQKAKFIAHEIKNSLSVINLYSKIAQKRLENVKAEDEILSSLTNALKCITNASENISSQIGDLRCLSTPYIVEVNLKKLVENTVNMCEKKAQDAGVDIKIADFDEFIIQTDKTKFECTLTNIIYNAIEACNSECEILINVKKEAEAIRILIKNNGEMISDEIKDKIFEENFTTKEKGNGLGLGICKKQMALIGASVNLVESTKDKTVFEIVLPL